MSDTATTITISLGVYASIVVIWYVLKGDIDARWKIILFGLASASLSWMAAIAVRVWGIADAAINTLMQVQQNTAGSGVLAPWL